MSTRPTKLVGILVVAVLILVAGYVAGRVTAPAKTTSTAETGKAQWWTCSMHPSVRSPEPGECPLCGMDLIPLVEDTETPVGPRQLRLSPTARKLADIEVQPVDRHAVEHTVRLVGTIDYDETRVATISAWVGGRLDRLYVDYTGIPVKKGDHMVWMYSPDVLAAQEELIQAKRGLADLPADSLLRRSAAQTLEATRDKLRLWGLGAEQVAAIEQGDTPSDHIQINAPIGGIVIHKNAVEGQYVQTGTPIYRIADLSNVWVQLDAYESDLPWLHYGQRVSFTVEAVPGETFDGRIAFIDPVLTARTRTVKVRVNVDNAAGHLKPNMFVRATVAARLAAGGKVIAPDLAGKWIGPMHPEIIQDGPGACPICGMPLVKAGELGYVSAEEATPLVVPASAPLLTGPRAVVYVRDPHDDGLFTGVEVVLGPRAGDYYVVESGLEEGDLVVTRGNFKIDSAMQIHAKPSMMSPPEQPLPPAPPTVSVDLDAVVEAYLGIAAALAADNHATAVTAAQAFLTALDATDTGNHQWMQVAGELRAAAENLTASQDLVGARAALAPLSESMAAAVSRFGKGLVHPLYKLHCPMAFAGRGAIWVQGDQDVKNPYFGAAMPGCGDVEATLVKPTGDHHHE